MLEEVPSLSVIPFFLITHDLKKKGKSQKTFYTKEYLIPSTVDYTLEEEFARVYMTYSDRELFFHIEVDTPFESSHKDFRKGDSVELFIDTRDLKTRKFMSSFCHHFVFYPEKLDGNLGYEVTKFRTDEIHPLAKPEDLQVKAHVSRSGYLLDIQLDETTLHGFRPQEFKKLGFTYRINRTDGEAQNFAFSSLEYLPENNPHLWGSLNLRG